MKTARKRKNRLISRIRISQLELLAAMDRTDTLSAAAREVNLTQPAASRLLRTLASDLDISLFERSSRGLRATAAGRALVEKAARLVADIDRTQQELEAIDSGLAGTTSIGAGVSSCYVIVPSALLLLMRTASRIVVTVREGPMEELLSKLRAGEIDLLVGRFGSDFHHSDLSTHELYQPPVCAVCGPRHPLAARRALSWTDLLDQAWILPEANTAMRNAVEGIFQAEKRRPERCFIESSSIQTNVALLRKSDLVWALSSDVAQYFAELGALKILKAPYVAAPGAFVLAHLSTRTLSPAAGRLAECLFKAAGK